MVRSLLKVEDGYQVLPDRTGNEESNSRSKQRSFNLVGLCRQFLTENMSPPCSPGSFQDFFGSASPGSDKLYKNSLLHNSSDNLMQVAESDGRVIKPLQPGSQRTCVLTLVATALGSGVLSLPYAFAHVGLVVGLLVLSIAACLSCMSLVILMLASRYTEAESFSALLALASGSSKAGLAVDVSLIMYGCCSILALLIFEGDFVTAILEEYGVASPSRTLAIIGAAVCAWPLVIQPQVSALRYVAALSPFAILYVGCNVVVQAPALFAERPADSEVEMWMWRPIQMLQAMSIFVFSVMCHANAVPVVHMLDRPSVARMVKVATYSKLCCWVLYMFIGVGGYLSFQGAVQGDFLSNYPVGRLSIQICRKMMTIVCYVGIPMNSGNCVHCLQKLVLAVYRRDTNSQMEHRPLLFAFLATMMLASATVGAIHLTNVAQVLGLVGGSLTTLQMFWFPAYVYWKILYPTQPPIFRTCVMCAMVTAGMAGFSSVLATLLPYIL